MAGGIENLDGLKGLKVENRTVCDGDLQPLQELPSNRQRRSEPQPIQGDDPACVRRLVTVGCNGATLNGTSSRRLETKHSDKTSTTGFRPQPFLVDDNCGRCNFHLGPSAESQNQEHNAVPTTNGHSLGPPSPREEQCLSKLRQSDAALASVGPNFLSVNDNNYPSECFPRCEYKARFTGTSAYQMTNPDHWGTYLRNTPNSGGYDRLTTRKLNEYQNPYTNAPSAVALFTGAFHSPWHNARYKEIFYEAPCALNVISKPSILYDRLLSYKNATCLIIEKLFNEQEVADKKLEVYYKNKYPCIVVQIKEFNNVLKNPISLYDIVIAHFVAITNKVARSENIPIELVIRQGFGHNIPSVVEMSTSFRINTGIVPEIYTGVLVKSLILLNDKFLVPLFKGSFQLNFTPTQINNHNDGVTKYNEHSKVQEEVQQSVDTWSNEEDLFKVLIKVGHIGGGSVSGQIIKLRKHVDLLANYVTEELGNIQPDLAKPLNKMLGKLIYSETGNILDVSEEDYKTRTLLEFSKEENLNIKEDRVFWSIVQDIALRLTVKGTEFSEAIKARKVSGLYSELEKANLEFIRNSSYQQAQDGCGSDSECEVDSTPALYSKKVIVSTGMRAINLAQFLSIYYLRQSGFCPQTNTEKMYYETEEAVKGVNDVFGLPHSFDREEQRRGNATVRFIDLNYCGAANPEAICLKDILKQISQNDVVILDYTSADTEQINESVNLLLTKVAVAVLVSSGHKNEQLGADMNTYGTIRIVVQDRSTLDELYLLLRKALEIREEVLPMELHRIRKAYKDVGAVVTNEAIYKRKYRKRSSNVARPCQNHNRKI